jgi:multiple sugar transport system substrate-binding protein
MRREYETRRTTRAPAVRDRLGLDWMARPVLYLLLAVIAAASVLSFHGPVTAQPATLKVWSHWGAEPRKQEVVMAVARQFEAKHPGTKVEITWWDKTQMYPAARAALAAGKGFPDVMYMFAGETDEFIKAGWVADLSASVNWENVKSQAKQSWTLPGPDGKTGVWAVTIEAWTDELLYNKKLFRSLGIQVPDDLTFTQDQFKDVVRKCTSAGLAAFANSVGDRDFPGQALTSDLLLSKLGEDDLFKLYTGALSFKDPRVLEVFRYVKELVDLKAFPPTFSTMTLAESHRYFHTAEKACMFVIGSWYTGRAFADPERGGQPKDFELGILKYPAMRDGKGVGMKFLGLGGGFGAVSKSPLVTQAAAFIGTFADESIGNLWTGVTSEPTALKTNPEKIKSERQAYVAEYARAHQGIRYPALVGSATWRRQMKPGLREAWVQVMNQALPAGVISVEDAADRLEQVRLSGK